MLAGSSESRFIERNFFRQSSDMADGFSLLSLSFDSLKWTGAIGTLYISPGILLRSEKERGRFSVKRLIPSPFVVNVLVIGFPIAICSGMVIGGVLGGVAYSKWRSKEREGRGI